jgi:hypothetical protein
MDASGRRLTNAGLICGITGTCAIVLLIMLGCVLTILSS